MAGSLGQRLRGARRQRFVGRTGEMELFRSTLTGADEPLRVLFLHGPGGVGKTAVLEALADVAAADGADPVRVD
ncbi:MAG: ATP-binding protein, partial [Actinomycetia bacterium]|nr:ATP-binding protein [Actinomycetes bacterium]